MHVQGTSSLQRIREMNVSYRDAHTLHGHHDAVISRRRHIVSRRIPRRLHAYEQSLLQVYYVHTPVHTMHEIPTWPGLQGAWPRRAISLALLPSAMQASNTGAYRLFARRHCEHEFTRSSIWVMMSRIHAGISLESCMISIVKGNSASCKDK